jgi:hypothetical protein
MPYDATVYNVVIASPSDVKEERKIARQAIYKWNALHSEEKGIVLLPVGWETHSHPESGSRPQAILNKQILKNADLLIGIFWTRFGTPTGEAESGTVEEIEEHIKAGKPAMLYFSNKHIMPGEIDNEQYDSVKAFKEQYRNKSLFHEFTTDQEFENSLYEHIVLKVNDSDYFKRSSLVNENTSPVRSVLDSEIPIEELSIVHLLASSDQQPEAVIKEHLKKKGIATLDYNLAMSSLREKGFVRQSNTDPVSYRLAPKGYQWAMRNKHLFDWLDAEVLSDEAKQLLIEASKSPDGTILRITTKEDLSIQTNNKNFVHEDDPRSEATWQNALKQLVENGFIEDRGYKGEVFAVTQKGYEYADNLMDERQHEK